MIVWGVKYFRYYLFGCKFIVIIDYNLLWWFMDIKNFVGCFVCWLLIF